MWLHWKRTLSKTSHGKRADEGRSQLFDQKAEWAWANRVSFADLVDMLKQGRVRPWTFGVGKRNGGAWWWMRPYADSHALLTYQHPFNAA